MKNVKLTLLAAAAIGAVSVGGASAMPFSDLRPALGDGDVHNARVVCDQYRRCYNTARTQRARPYYTQRYRNRPAYYGQYGYGRPVYGQYGYGYGYGGPGYAYYGAPAVGLGIGPFGFGMGIW